MLDENCRVVKVNVGASVLPEFEIVTVDPPAGASSGTVKVAVELESVRTTTLSLPNVADTAPAVNPEPEIVTVVPTAPDVGEIDVTDAADAVPVHDPMSANTHASTTPRREGIRRRRPTIARSYWPDPSMNHRACRQIHRPACGGRNDPLACSARRFNRVDAVGGECRERTRWARAPRESSDVAAASRPTLDRRRFAHKRCAARSGL